MVLAFYAVHLALVGIIVLLPALVLQKVLFEGLILRLADLLDEPRWRLRLRLRLRSGPTAAAAPDALPAEW